VATFADCTGVFEKESRPEAIECGFAIGAVEGRCSVSLSVGPVEELATGVVSALLVGSRICRTLLHPLESSPLSLCEEEAGAAGTGISTAFKSFAFRRFGDLATVVATTGESVVSDVADLRLRWRVLMRKRSVSL
jgi:hypothetical protein